MIASSHPWTFVRARQSVSVPISLSRLTPQLWLALYSEKGFYFSATWTNNDPSLTVLLYRPKLWEGLGSVCDEQVVVSLLPTTTTENQFKNISLTTVWPLPGSETLPPTTLSLLDHLWRKEESKYHGTLVY